jgi:hypothetical protein
VVGFFVCIVYNGAMIGDSPKPNDKEVESGERIFAEMLALAKTVGALGAKHAEGGVANHKQFGNNFYLIFESLKRQKTDPDAAIVTVYLRRMEKKYRAKWKRFLKENTDLIKEIQEVLEQKKQYDELLSLFMKLLRNPKAKHLVERVGKEINFESVGVKAWNKINPLLERASVIMNTYGIEAEEFYG